MPQDVEESDARRARKKGERKRKRDRDDEDGNEVEDTKARSRSRSMVPPRGEEGLKDKAAAAKVKRMARMAQKERNRDGRIGDSDRLVGVKGGGVQSTIHISGYT